MRTLIRGRHISMQSILPFKQLRTHPSTAATNCRRRIRCLSGNAVGLQPAQHPYQQLTLEEVLQKVRQASRGHNSLDRTNTSAMAFGVGVHMGCEVSWTFIWRPDGAFYEEVRSSHLTYKWGFDGGSNSHCWEVDPTGVSKVLEFDDHEASLLGALIKGGGWLVPDLAQQRLEIELEGKDGSSQLWRQYKPELNMPPVAYTVEQPRTATVAAASSSSNGRQRQQNAHQHQQQQQQLGIQLLQQQQHNSSSSRSRVQQGPVVAAAAMQADQAVSHEAVAVQAYCPDLAVVIKLKGGRMLARLQINPETWQVKYSSHPLCSETEFWRYTNWQNWTDATHKNSSSSSNSNNSSTESSLPDVIYPREIEHVLFSGCAHKYTTLGAQARSADIHRAYQLPASPPVPVDAQYLETYSSQVPVWQTVSGHLLAECHINGRRAGWMILDTGASGFVIEPGVADQYGLPQFGNLRIAGVAGKVKTRFRRASQLRMGPLLLSDPVMMEMRASRLVHGFHDRVVGIAGFDVFRRCRITLPSYETRKSLTKATSSHGRVQPCVGRTSDNNGSSSSNDAFALQWPPTAATTQQLADYAAVQKTLLQANNSATDAPAVATAVQQQQQQHSRTRRGLRHPAGSSSSSNAQARSPAAAVAAAVDPASSRRRRKTSSSSSSSSSSSVAAAAAEAVPPAASQQQQQQHVGQFNVPPLVKGPGLGGNKLVEMLLQRPHMVKGPHELEQGYIWQDIVMIASLPHVELEFISPGTSKRHRSLFMVDTGAAGSEVMFHSRASRELKLLDTDANPSAHNYISGVGGADVGGVAPTGAPQLAVQAGQLPEVVIHGQAGSNPNASGSLVLQNVAALFSKSGGLDISLYSAGMVCIDLLSRMQVVLDYPNKRIGWKIPPVENDTQKQQQQGQLSAVTAPAAES